MAIIKHLSSKNADYSQSITYLLYKHDEETQKPILDEQGRLQLRDEYYMDGILCDPMDFDAECQKTNNKFRKNQKYNDIKSHHFIISFDPKDATEKGLTGEKAQELCLDFAKKYFPGHQALVVTHMDGHRHSGNIHTHIVINSVRKEDVPEQEFMERPADHKAGYKHHHTKKFLRYLDQKVMDMCKENDLHQIDLFSPAPVKITEKEYRLRNRKQKELDALNEDIKKAGLTPRTTIYKTQKQRIRDAVDSVAKSAINFQDFQEQLFEKHEISVIEKRGRFRYQLPDRERIITDKALGANYGKTYLCSLFEKHTMEKEVQREQISKLPDITNLDYHKDPMLIFLYPSKLRLVVDLQNCVKAQQNQAYAQKVEISNLQQIAETLIYLQDHGYDSWEQLKEDITNLQNELQISSQKISDLKTELKEVKSQIHYLEQYYNNKKCYNLFSSSKNKGLFRKKHSQEISNYETARKNLKSYFPDEKFPSTKTLQAKKVAVTENMKGQNTLAKKQNFKLKELQIADTNISAIFDNNLSIKQPDKEKILLL